MLNKMYNIVEKGNKIYNYVDYKTLYKLEKSNIKIKFYSDVIHKKNDVNNRIIYIIDEKNNVYELLTVYAAKNKDFMFKMTRNLYVVLNKIKEKADRYNIFNENTKIGAINDEQMNYLLELQNTLKINYSTEKIIDIIGFNPDEEKKNKEIKNKFFATVKENFMNEFDDEKLLQKCLAKIGVKGCNDITILHKTLIKNKISNSILKKALSLKENSECSKILLEYSANYTEEEKEIINSKKIKKYIVLILSWY